MMTLQSLFISSIFLLSSKVLPSISFGESFKASLVPTCKIMYSGLCRKIGFILSCMSSMLFHTGVSAVGTGDHRGGEYCIEFTVCRSINSSFTEQEAELLKSLILIFCSFDKVANLARRYSLDISLKSLIFVICLYMLSILLPFFRTLSSLLLFLNFQLTIYKFVYIYTVKIAQYWLI